MKDFSIYFNNKNSYEDLDILLKEEVYLSPNSEEIETININDRNGSLTRKKGTFPDREIDITFVLPHLNKDEMYYKLEEIVDWLEDVEDNRLMLNDHRYYKVKHVSYGDITSQALRFFEITITFTLEPFKYDYNEEEREVYSNVTIENLGNVYSEPIITITPKGNITNFTITTNGDIFKIVDTVNKTVTINSELKKCVSNNLNINTSGNYPILNRGENIITFDESKADVKINYISRWR